jgi:hypothetical protein
MSASVFFATMRSFSMRSPPTTAVTSSEEGAARTDARGSSRRVGECRGIERDEDDSGGTGDVENARQ